MTAIEEAVNRLELIALAKEAGFVPNYGIAPLPMVDYATYGIDPTLERFAQLVAEKKDKRIAELETKIQLSVEIIEALKRLHEPRTMLMLDPRVADLERKLAVAREALKYHMEQTRPIQRTIDALAQIGGDDAGN